MGNLSAPIRSKYVERIGDETLKVTTCAMQGLRVGMEDHHLVQMGLPNHPDYYLFGVFDGHNGELASEYLAKNLAQELDKLPQLTDRDIRQRILELDEAFCKRQRGDDGSTIVIVLIKLIKDNEDNKDHKKPQKKPKKSKQQKQQQQPKQPKQSQQQQSKQPQEYEASVHWLGDSRAVWIKSNGSFQSLTKDHHPDEEKEKKRIEKAHGRVEYGRVDGQLAMSRAFGDKSYKSDTTIPRIQQKVIAYSEWHPAFTAKPGDWILLFCDGLVESFDDKEVVGRLRNAMQMNHDPGEALCQLLDEVLDGGSTDNMSACLIQLESGKNYGTGNKGKEFIPGPLYQMRRNEEFVKAYWRFASRYGHQDNTSLRIIAYQQDLELLNRYGSWGYNNPEKKRPPSSSPLSPTNNFSSSERLTPQQVQSYTNEIKRCIDQIKITQQLEHLQQEKQTELADVEKRIQTLEEEYQKLSNPNSQKKEDSSITNSTQKR